MIIDLRNEVREKEGKEMATYRFEAVGFVEASDMIQAERIAKIELTNEGYVLDIKLIKEQVIA